MKRRVLMCLLVLLLVTLTTASPAHARVRAENPAEGLKGNRAYIYPEYLQHFSLLGDGDQINTANVKMVNKDGSNRGFRWAVDVHNYANNDWDVIYYLTITYSSGSPYTNAWLASDSLQSREMKVAQTTYNPSLWNIYVNGTPIAYDLYWYTDYRTSAGTEVLGERQADDGLFSQIWVLNPSREWRLQSSGNYPSCYGQVDMGSYYTYTFDLPYYNWHSWLPN